jgi:hypothetical protein
MPPIKRWFPVSHDINSDPEVVALTDAYGLTGLKVWLELLSIGDRNEGVIGSDLDSIVRSLSIKCNSTQSRVRLVCDWIVTRLWVDCDSTVRLHNYAKYHRTREPISNPPDLPNLPNHTRPIKPPKSPKGGRPIEDLVFRKFWAIYPKKVGRDSAYRAWCKEARHCSDVQDEIFASLGWQVEQRQWRADGGRYIPHPATWLNRGGWKDEPQPAGPERNEADEQIQRILKRGL